MKLRDKIIIFCLGLFLVFLFSLEDSNLKLENNYIYLGPSNEEFEFLLDSYDGRIYHVLNLSYVYANRENYVSTIPFEYSPFELEEIYMEDTKDLILDSNVVLFTRDPYLDILGNSRLGVAFSTMIRILDNAERPFIFDVPTGIGLTSPKPGDNSTIVTCKDSTPQIRVIELRLLKQNMRQKFIRNFVNQFVKEGVRS